MTSSLISKKSVRVDIEFDDDNKEEVVFYCVSVRQLLNLKNLVKDVAAAVNKIMTDAKTYAGYESEQSGNDKDFFQKTRVQGLQAAMAERLEKRKEEGIAALLEIVTDQKKLEAIAQMISDCIREDKERFSPGAIIASDSYVFVQLALGAIEANMALFRPIQRGLQTLLPRQEIQVEADSETEGKQN